MSAGVKRALPWRESIPAGAKRDPTADPSLQTRPPPRPLAPPGSAATIASIQALKHPRVAAAVKAARPPVEERAANAKTFLGRRRWHKLHKDIKAFPRRRRSGKGQIGTRGS